jgi:hypothetical protein
MFWNAVDYLYPVFLGDISVLFMMSKEHACNLQYKQNEGLAMLAILAEIFLQHLEHKYIVNILQRHHIIDYYRYVDDILFIYN